MMSIGTYFVPLVKESQDKNPVTFHTHVATYVLETRKPTEGLFCHLGIEVLSLLVLLGVKFLDLCKYVAFGFSE